MDEKLESCLEEVGACYRRCMQTLNYCLGMRGKHLELKHLTPLRDCANICQTTEGFILRESLHTRDVARECAEICEECALSCEQVDLDDEQMKECEKICRQCATACRAL